jgi:hypothetical protein
LIVPPAPRDILVFDVTNGGETLEAGLRMYDSEFKPIDENRTVARPGKSIRLQGTFQPNTVMYLQVWGSSGTKGHYSLRVSPTHAFDVHEPNDTLATATRVPVGSLTAGSIMDGKDVDCYVTESPVTASVTVEISTHAASLTPVLSFFGPDRKRLSIEPVGRVGGELSRFKFTVQAKQQYFIQVAPAGGSKGDYSLKVE